MLFRSEIVLIEEYPCNFKSELHERETYWIKQTECVNKNYPNRSTKQYYIDNKDRISEQQKKQYKNKRVNCQFCNLELNQSSLKRHIKRFHQESIPNKL